MASNFCKKARGFSQAHQWSPMSAKPGYMKCDNGCGAQKKMDRQQATMWYGNAGGTFLDEIAGQPVKGSAKLLWRALLKMKRKK